MDVVEGRKISQDTVCACCNQYRLKKEVKYHQFSKVQHLMELLRKDLAPTTAVPRNGPTIWQHNGVSYCLQAAVDAGCIKGASSVGMSLASGSYRVEQAQYLLDRRVCESFPYCTKYPC
mmetsp:Transcript_33986/g.75349  ORF Transcript_33986/g.75349 Transcript_33986/m.75349 type:complete len:119 (-) Transcript_33986:151-507(-)